MLAKSHALVALTLFGPMLFSAALQASEPLTLDVFTAAELPVGGQDDLRLRGATAIVYAVDGLEQFESTLSQNLRAYADAATHPDSSYLLESASNLVSECRNFRLAARVALA